MDITKYENYKTKLVNVLMEFLFKLNTLEEKYYLMNEEFDKSYEGNQIPDELISREREIWTNFKDEKVEILKAYCTSKITDAPRIGGQMGSPTQFYFIEKEHELNFVMKSERKATIEINYEEWSGSCFGKQFVFTHTDDGWKINSIKERLGKDESWTKTYL